MKTIHCSSGVVERGYSMIHTSLLIKFRAVLSMLLVTPGAGGIGTGWGLGLGRVGRGRVGR